MKISFNNINLKIILLFSLLFVNFSFSQGLKTSGKKIINKQGDEVLLRGMGPGGWLVMEGYMNQSAGLAGPQHEIKSKLIELMGAEKTEIFFKEWRKNHFTKRDVDSLAAWGFNSIRIPMHYNLMTLPIEDEPVAGQQTWIDEGFTIIDNVLEWAKPHNMYVILDLHAAPGGQGYNADISDYDDSKPSLWESEANQVKTIALWRKIAEKYKDNQWIGGYDLINETNWNLPGGTLLRQLFEQITTAIREVDKKHIIFIEGNDFANNFTGLTPPWDDNMVYSFHKYWSTVYENDLDWITPLRETHNVPLWMGESGENSNTWYTDFISLLEKKDIGWAWWTIKKVGDIDSPFSVKLNSGYQKILDFWKNEGDKPTEEEAYSAMMQLAEDLLIENCKYRKDIPDAMFRQVQTDLVIPYSKQQTIPGILYLSDYDLGKNNFAYYDVDVADDRANGEFKAWNSGWQYRNDGVDIETNDDSTNSNGHHIGFVHKGEWIKYTIKVKETGAYKAVARFAAETEGGQFHLSLNDEDITTTQTVSGTGSWFKFSNHSDISDILIDKGEHSFKIHFDSETPFNIGSIQFVKTGNADSVDFTVLNGSTGSNEKSVKISLNHSLLSSSINRTKNDFVLLINGTEKSIKSIESSSIKERTIIINAEDNMLFSDEIKISYSGTAIKSKSGQVLKPFTNLIINNTLQRRFVIPGKIEVEDTKVKIGLGTEDTTDEGGGKNLGYTDAGDYADYLIYNKEALAYKVDFRVAAESSTGKIGLYIMDDMNREYEICVVDTPNTNGWQNWVTTSVNSKVVAKGIFKLRLKVLKGGFNLNWIKFSNIDTDDDGVLDKNDRCPETPSGTQVDFNGCQVFSLPVDNNKVSVNSATCIGSSDGLIGLSIEDASYDYTITVTNNDNVTITGDSKIASVSGLAKGTYSVCFTVDGQADYEQCFDVVIGEPKALSAFIDVDNDKRTTNIQLGGSKSYNIDVNGERFDVKGDRFNTTLPTGLSIIKISTDLDCQGIIEREIFISEDVFYYPNPTKGEVDVFVNGEDKGVKMSVFTTKGDLVFTRDQEILDSRKTGLNLTGVPAGTYLVTLEGTTVRKTFKIVKR